MRALALGCSKVTRMHALALGCGKVTKLAALGGEVIRGAITGEARSVRPREAVRV